MIKMAEILLAQYADCKKLYISWDAASWHMSKELLAFVKNNNNKKKALFRANQISRKRLFLKMIAIYMFV